MLHCSIKLGSYKRQAHYCFSSTAMYSVFQNKSPPQQPKHPHPPFQAAEWSNRRIPLPPSSSISSLLLLQHPMYFSFQNKNPPQHTHSHTYHVRLHNKINEKYRCHLPHPSLATIAILVLLAPHQSLRHAPDQVFQIGIFLPRLDITIGGQQLRDSQFELEGGDDFVILQILEFPDCQVVVPCCTFQRRENNTSTIDTWKIWGGDGSWQI